MNKRVKIDICWVYSSSFSPIGCYSKWKRFYSKEKAKEWVSKCESKKKHMFFRYILINNREVENL